MGVNRKETLLRRDSRRNVARSVAHHCLHIERPDLLVTHNVRRAERIDASVHLKIGDTGKVRGDKGVLRPVQKSRGEAVVLSQRKLLPFRHWTQIYVG